MEAVPTRVTTLLVRSLVPARVAWSWIQENEVVKVNVIYVYCIQHFMSICLFVYCHFCQVKSIHKI